MKRMKKLRLQFTIPGKSNIFHAGSDLNRIGRVVDPSLSRGFFSSLTVYRFGYQVRRLIYDVMGGSGGRVDANNSIRDL